MDKTAKQRLASYRALRLEVDNQLDRLARLRNEEQLPAMRESSGAKSTGGNGDRMERAILRRMEYEERITPQIEAAKREGPVAKNKFATGPYLYSFSYRRQNFTPNCGKLFTFRACLRRLHRFGGA